MKKLPMKELDKERKSKVEVDVKSRLPAEITRQTANRMAPSKTKEAKIDIAPTTLSEVDMSGLSEDERKKMVSAIRREYQRQYYQKHKEKAKEYQRQYNLTHKKKVRGGRGKASFECPREQSRMTFNTADLMHSPSEKTLDMLKKILSGEKMFTM